MKLNMGFMAAWFNRWSWLKYTALMFIVETVNPPRMGIKSKAVANNTVAVVANDWLLTILNRSNV
jgi:hypothetical protein